MKKTLVGKSIRSILSKMEEIMPEKGDDFIELRKLILDEFNDFERILDEYYKKWLQRCFEIT